MSNVNAIPLYNVCNNLRNAKLTQALYPSEMRLLCGLLHLDTPKEEALSKAIPDFPWFIVVEYYIRNFY